MILIDITYDTSLHSSTHWKIIFSCCSRWLIKSRSVPRSLDSYHYASLCGAELHPKVGPTNSPFAIDHLRSTITKLRTPLHFLPSEFHWANFRSCKALAHLSSSPFLHVNPHLSLRQPRPHASHPFPQWSQKLWPGCPPAPPTQL